jgi:monovalent cation/hydrogen antiporter
MPVLRPDRGTTVPRMRSARIAASPEDRRVALFESVLTLLLLAILLLQVSRRLGIPYPTMLAAAGLGVAALPWAPEIALDPHLVLALFIAPALLDAAFDFPVRAIRRYWLSLFVLAVIAVVATTAAVAWVGVTYAGLPLAAAVALGAIVSPPDAAAAAAMLNRPSVPRSTAAVLKGESLLNDAVALLIFSLSLQMTMTGADAGHLLPQLAFAVPGGILLGIVIGRAAGWLVPYLAGTLGSILFQFAATFSTWILAERLGFSAILAVVATAMTAARYTGSQSARDRLHTNSVWSVVVFVLNVLAFLFVGLQARVIVRGLDPAELRHAIGFSFAVLGMVVVVRIVLVLAYNRAIQPIYRRLGYGSGPSLKQGVLAAWCGMRGMVTLAAALALPASFPDRGLVVLSALTVVLGTLVIQGLTLEPLIRLLHFPEDTSQQDEIALARRVLAEAAEQAVAEGPHRPADIDGVRALDDPAFRLAMVRCQRDALDRLRREGRIEEDVFRAIEQELDLEEVAAMRDPPFNLVDA